MINKPREYTIEEEHLIFKSIETVSEYAYQCMDYENLEDSSKSETGLHQFIEKVWESNNFTLHHAKVKTHIDKYTMKKFL